MLCNYGIIYAHKILCVYKIVLFLLSSTYAVVLYIKYSISDSSVSITVGISVSVLRISHDLLSHRIFLISVNVGNGRERSFRVIAV